jgi:hypothetical protein
MGGIAMKVLELWSVAKKFTARLRVWRSRGYPRLGFGRTNRLIRAPQPFPRLAGLALQLQELILVLLWAEWS